MTDMSERVNVKILLLFGEQAEVIADAPDPAAPERYPAVDIAKAVGRSPHDLPGLRLTAEVGADNRLSGWRLA